MDQGAGGKRSVNDIWRELQSATAPRGRLGGLAYTTQRAAQPRQLAAKKPSFIAGLQPGGAGSSAPGAATCSADAAAASLQRDINCLADGERRLRVQALERLSARLLGEGPGATEALRTALAGPLLVPLVRLLADAAERCRELAAAFLDGALQRLDGPAASGVLPTLVPALVERVGGAPAEEASEEIRLALAQLAAGIVGRHAAGLVGMAGSDGTELLGGVVQVLCGGLEDSYADIKKVACTSVAQLAESPSVGAACLEPHLEALLGALLPLLQHQHSRVRLAALEALHALVTKGLRHHELEQSVAPAVGPLTHDRAAGVRSALFASAAQWLGCPPPSGAAPHDPDGLLRSQRQFALPLFLPTLLLGLTDEQEATRAEVVQLVEGVVAAQHSPQAATEEGGVHPMVVAGLPGYSHPFKERPSPAARALVQAQLPRLVALAAKGAAEWTVPLRAEAARLLHAALVYAEGFAMQHLPGIISAIQAGIADEDAGVAAEAMAAAHVLGVHTPPRHWAPFVAEALSGEQLTPAQRATGLRVLNALLHAAGAAGQPSEQETVALLAGVLGREGLVAAEAQQLQVQLQEQQLAAVSELLRWGGQQCSTVALELLRLLLEAAARENASAAAAATAAGEAAAVGGSAAAPGAVAPPTAAGVVAELAAACGLGTAQQLCDQLAPRLLPLLSQDCESWHGGGSNWTAFSALLRCCGGNALAAMGPGVLVVLQPLVSHEAEPGIRLSLLALAGELLQDDSKSAAWPGGLGVALAAQLLLPTMVWRAGDAAAAARFAALSALYAMLQQRRLPEAELLGLVRDAGMLQLLLQCLDEDYRADTRHTAATALDHLLSSVGQHLSAEQLSAAQQELGRRLDDSSNAVRIAACGVLAAHIPLLLSAAPLPENAAAQLAATLLLHLDDAEPEVQEAACGVVEVLARRAPGGAAAVRERAAALVGVHRGRAYLDRVLAACGPL